MGKSSIHIQKASGGSVHHNSRENFSHSVVFTDEKNEVWNNAKDSFTIYRDELKIRSEAYSNSTGQKLQSRAVTQLSAVLNLEQHHTLKDLEPIKKYLEKEFDTKVYQMAIHRDEGKIKHKETGEYLVSGTDFFLNPKDNNLYYDKKYTKPLNLQDYEIEKNYHAHIEMMGLKSDGKAIRQDMNKFKLSKLQDFVAESLQMERGNNYQIKKSAKILDTHQFKASKKRENEIINREKEDKKKLKEDLEKLKEENNLFRTELKEYEAKREDYKKQEDLNKQLQADLKASKIDLATALEQIEELKKDIFHPVKTYKKDNSPAKYKDVANYYLKENNSLQEQNKELETQNKSLEEQNKTLENKVITLEEKINSSANMSDYEQIKKENEELKKENASLKEKVKSILAAANEKIKSLFQFKVWNNYKHKQTKFDLEYINENKQDYWEELAHYHPKIETLYKENLDSELIKSSDFIPGETPNYSKMNLQEILKSPIKKEDLKKAQDNLKELLEENKETVVNIRKLF